MTSLNVETRIKKWQLYRNEIINEGILIDKIANDSAIAKRYKEVIDKLNPRILMNSDENRSLAKLISINENKMHEIKVLEKFTELIDDQRLFNVNKEITEWVSQYNNLSIINEKGNISEEWLNEDENYNEIYGVNTRIEMSSNKWAAFQFTSKDQLVKIDSLEKNENAKVIIDNLSTIRNHEEQISKFSKLLYVIPAIAGIFFLLLSIILLVIKIGEL